MKLSIIIPAYNEESRLGPMLDAYLDYFLPRYGSEVEVIVAVNGSTDRTDEVASGYAARHPQVQVLVEPRKIGKGGAVIMGFDRAVGDHVGFTDADGATPPAAFDNLVERIGRDGAIIASRWLPGSQVAPGQPLSRRIASRIFNLEVRLLFGLGITDTQCGAKLLSREAWAAVRPVIGVTRWAFDVDLLFQLKRAGYPTKEIPTTWHDVSGSKINVPRASLEMTLAIYRLRLLHSPFSWLVTLYDKTLGVALKSIYRT
jgi:dolichol-phosphate mannosyltransferase